MNEQRVNLAAIPTTSEVLTSLRDIFLKEEIDLRDVTAIACQDPVVLANIVLSANVFFAEKNRPVVNSVESAINLIGMDSLKKSLMSIQCIDDLELSTEQKLLFGLIKNRIYVAACMTKFWGQYMGEKNIEEQFCASMFTGLNELYHCIFENEPNQSTVESNFLESIDTMRLLYCFEEEIIPRIPDSIQQLLSHDSWSKRLELSIVVYELIASLELGYASDKFNRNLHRLTEIIDQSVSRASYDFARELVQLERSSKYSSYRHTWFLLSTNVEEIDLTQALAA